MPQKSIASTGTDEKLDRLFDAIRDQNPVKVREILGVHPGLVNSFNRRRQETPQKLFDEKRYEYLLTQDILRRKVHGGIVVTEICHQGPLHLACMIGDDKTVEALLEQKHIDLGLENGSRETSFSIACRSANLRTARLLLEKGFKMSPNMEDNAHYGPLDYLVYRGVYPEWPENPPQNQFEVLKEVIEKIMDEFLDQESQVQLLRSVVVEGNVPMFDAVFEAFWGMTDTTDEEGWTLLHLAAAGGHIEIVDRLLNKGADPNARTRYPERMDAGEIALEFLRESGAAKAIRAKVLSAQSNGDSNQEGTKHGKRRCWRWVSGTEQLQMRSSTVNELIKDYGRENQTMTKGKTLWCHFQANSEQWIKDLYRNLSKQDIVQGEHLGHIRAAFDFASRLPLNRYGLAEASLPRINEKGDIALIDETKFDASVHPARTLDAYADTELSGKPLAKYNVDQVVSRWFRKHHEQSKDAGACNDDDNQRNTSNASSSLRIWFLKATSRPLLAADVLTGDLERQSPREPRTGSNRLILVVSQLWLFKFGDILITSYPERWNSYPRNDQFFERLSKKMKERPVKNLTAKLLFHKNMEESMKFQAKIPLALLDTETPSNADASQRGSPKSGSPEEKRANAASYLEIFRKETMRIWRDVDEVSQDFKTGQFEANEKFAEYTARATECLLNLDDVLGEIGKIKGVLEYQLSIWNELHVATSSDEKRAKDVFEMRDTDEATKLRQIPLATVCGWDDGCKPSLFREKFFNQGVFSLADKVERDAKMLRDKTKTLIDLLYGQASTESSIKSYQLSRNITIFTWLTVIFTPLSFITALFSLEIEAFTPEEGTWTIPQLVTASVWCVFVTLFVTLLYLLIQKTNPRRVQTVLQNLWR